MPVLLQSVFVPNSVRADPPPVELSKELWRRLIEAGEIGEEELPEGLDLEMLGHARAEYGMRPVLPVLSVITAESNRLLVLLGDPGSGKSTLARFLALSLAGNRVVPDLTPLVGCLPILIELRSFADLRSECHSFIEYVDRLHTMEGLGLPADLLEHYLRADGRALVIFDGVDELFDLKEREAVSRQIAGFAVKYPKVRVIVTSRIIGYRRSILQDADFEHFTLQDLDDGQISEFVDRWYAIALSGQPKEAYQRKERMLRAVADSPSIRELAGNPLLLTILAIIGRRQELPRERRAVYAHAAAVLVEQWDVNRHLRDSSVQADYIDSEDRRELLRRVASGMQAGRSGLAGNHISGAELIEEFDAYLRGRYQLDPATSAMVARVMLKQFHARNFILSRYGGTVYGFIHRAFLEYFCADEIVQRFGRTRELSPAQLASDIFGKHWADESWHEVLLLVAGMIDERFAALSISHLLEVANPHWRASATSPALRNLTLALRCLGEVRRLGEMTTQGHAIIDRIIEALEYSNSAADWVITDAIEQDILPIAVAIGPRLPGRERYRDWFLSGGNQLVRTPVASLAALLLAALFKDSRQVLAHLRMQALNAENPALRQAAVRALAQGWPAEPDTLTLLRECATGDSHGYVRQSAVQAIAHGWSADPEIKAWIRGRAISDEDSYVRRGAVLALAQSWNGDQEAGLLLRQRILSDSDQKVRRGAANALVDGWADDTGTLDWIAGNALSASDGYIRASAIRVLSVRWSRDQLLPLLRERISTDEYALVRQTAIHSLARRWRGQADVMPMLRQRASADSNSLVRQAAVRALGAGWQNDPETLPFLRERAVSDPEWNVRRAAVRVLAVEWPNRNETRQWLHQRAASADDLTIRTAAIEAVAAGWREHKDTYPLLLECASSDEDPDVRATALRALADGWRDEQTFRLIRKFCQTDENAAVRESAVNALAATWRHHTVSAQTLRYCATEDAASLVRCAALKALAEGWSDDPQTFLLLQNTAATEASDEIRGAALKAFAASRREDPDVFVLLQERAVIDEHWDNRRLAVEALAAEWAEHEETLPLLRSLSTGDSNWAVRRAATRAVAAGWHDDPDTLALIHDRAAEDGSWPVREAAIRALANGWHDDPGTHPLIRKHAEYDREGIVRGAAIRAIANGWHDHPGTLELLHAKSEDREPVVRDAAIRALANGWHDDPGTPPLIRKHAEYDVDANVRSAAIGALANGWPGDPEILVFLQDQVTAVDEVMTAKFAPSTTWRKFPASHNATLDSSKSNVVRGRLRQRNRRRL
ncbi:MAG TPA: HEAT repeat domain-containing protein [Terracidiphilus sp.]